MSSASARTKTPQSSFTNFAIVDGERISSAVPVHAGSAPELVLLLALLVEGPPPPEDVLDPSLKSSRPIKTAQPVEDASVAARAVPAIAENDAVRRATSPVLRMCHDLPETINVAK